MTMCKFLSAIVLKNGDIICDPQSTDSHEDLIKYLDLKDDIISQAQESFCRVEFIPDYDDIFDLSEWKLVLDESVKPSWYDEKKVRPSWKE